MELAGKNQSAVEVGNISGSAASDSKKQPPVKGKLPESKKASGKSKNTVEVESEDRDIEELDEYQYDAEWEHEYDIDNEDARPRQTRWQPSRGGTRGRGYNSWVPRGNATRGRGGLVFRRFNQNPAGVRKFSVPNDTEEDDLPPPRKLTNLQVKLQNGRRFAKPDGRPLIISDRQNVGFSSASRREQEVPPPGRYNKRMRLNEDRFDNGRDDNDWREDRRSRFVGDSGSVNRLGVYRDDDSVDCRELLISKKLQRANEGEADLREKIKRKGSRERPPLFDGGSRRHPDLEERISHRDEEPSFRHSEKWEERRTSYTAGRSGPGRRSGRDAERHPDWTEDMDRARDRGRERARERELEREIEREREERERERELQRQREREIEREQQREIERQREREIEREREREERQRKLERERELERERKREVERERERLERERERIERERQERQKELERQREVERERERLERERERIERERQERQKELERQREVERERERLERERERIERERQERQKELERLELERKRESKMERERKMAKEKEIEREREREPDRDRGRGRERERDLERGRGVDRGGEPLHLREVEREKEREREREREKRVREKEREKGRMMMEERNSFRDRERDRDRERLKDRELERERSGRRERPADEEWRDRREPPREIKPTSAIPHGDRSPRKALTRSKPGDDWHRNRYSETEREGHDRGRDYGGPLPEQPWKNGKQIVKDWNRGNNPMDPRYPPAGMSAAAGKGLPISPIVGGSGDLKGPAKWVSDAGPSSLEGGFWHRRSAVEHRDYKDRTSEPFGARDIPNQSNDEPNEVIFILGLAPDVTELEIRQNIRDCDLWPSAVQLIVDNAGKSQGIMVVTFNSKDEAYSWMSFRKGRLALRNGNYAPMIYKSASYDWMCVRCNVPNYKNNPTCCSCKRIREECLDGYDEASPYPTNALLLRNVNPKTSPTTVINTLKCYMSNLRLERLQIGPRCLCFLELTSVVDALALYTRLVGNALMIDKRQIVVSYARLECLPQMADIRNEPKPAQTLSPAPFINSFGNAMYGGPQRSALPMVNPANPLQGKPIIERPPLLKRPQRLDFGICDDNYRLAVAGRQNMQF